MGWLAPVPWGSAPAWDAWADWGAASVARRDDGTTPRPPGGIIPRPDTGTTPRP